MSDAAERLISTIKKVASDAAATGRADVAGSQFNLMATDDVARVMDAKGADMVAKVSDAVALAAAGTVEAQVALSDALEGVADAIDEMEATDIAPLTIALNTIAKATKLSGDKSRNGAKEIAESILLVLSVIEKSQADAKHNAEMVVAATNQNTKALEKVAQLLSADKSVDYDENGRPATIRVAK